MARRWGRKSWTKRIVVLSILALAGFGGYTLYRLNQSQVNAGVNKVEKVGKKIGRVVEAGRKAW